MRTRCWVAVPRGPGKGLIPPVSLCSKIVTLSGRNVYGDAGLPVSFDSVGMLTGRVSLAAFRRGWRSKEPKSSARCTHRKRLLLHAVLPVSNSNGIQIQNARRKGRGATLRAEAGRAGRYRAPKSQVRSSKTSSKPPSTRNAMAKSRSGLSLGLGMETSGRVPG